MIVFPLASYNSFITVEDAGVYFETRLHSTEFISASIENQVSALITAFHSISELSITIDPTDTDQILALKNAQCEQAIYELKEDLDTQNLTSFDLLGIKTTKRELPRYSQRALAILRSYLSMSVCQIVR